MSDPASPPSLADEVLSRFLQEARDAAAAPVWCNRVYVQPVGEPGTGAAVVFGGGHVFNTIGLDTQASVRVASSQWINRHVALTLTSILVRQFNITAEELTSTADAIFGPLTGSSQK